MRLGLRPAPEQKLNCPLGFQPLRMVRKVAMSHFSDHPAYQVRLTTQVTAKTSWRMRGLID